MRTLLAFLGGLAAGATVALLLAPEKGEVTRKRIKDMVDRDLECATDYLDTAKKRIKKGVNRSVDRMEEDLQDGRKRASKAAKEAIDNMAKAVKKE